MQVDGQDFVDFAEVVGQEELARIMMEVDRVHQGPQHAEHVAYFIVKLRDEGDDESRRLAFKTLHEYFRAWLRYGSAEELRERVEGALGAARG